MGIELDYARNRYYDPARGRFTTPDPAASGEVSRPSSWNRYSYTEGDPVNFNDPQGLYMRPTLPGDGGGGGYCPPEYSWYDCYGGDYGGSLGGPIPYLPVGGGEGGGGGAGGSSAWICPPKYQKWINAHGADAASVADPIGTTEANVLALSAYESGWGGGNFVVNGGNAFFNLESSKPRKDSPDPAPFRYSTGWRTAGQPTNLPNGKQVWATVATYASYLDSAKSFSYYKGSLFQDVTDTMRFGTIASQHGFGITASTFASIADIFVKCLQ